MTKQRMVRDEPQPASATRVFRGHEPDTLLLHDNAVLNFELYGFYGLSVFYPADGWDVEPILKEKLGAAAQITT